MKYIYLDESVSQDGNYVGYGALILSNEILAKQIIEESLAKLINDPDREQEQCREMDNRTIERKYFHACEDSKNSHSHFCESINTLMKGEFTCQIFDKRNLKDSESSTEYLFDLTSGLSSLEVFQTREPIAIVFEERSGLSKEKLEKWLQSYTNRVLATVYDHPYIPTLFPEIKIEISSKNNNGLECCDFLLWGVMRMLQGKMDWYNRLKPRVKAESKPDSKEWNSVSMTFGKLEDKNNSINYKLDDYPINPDLLINNDYLVKFYVHAEKLITYLIQTGVPEHLKYMEDEIRNLADTTMDLNYLNRIYKVAKTYIKLFDTLPVIPPDCKHTDKKFLLLSKKYVALVLRDDLINGVRTRAFLEKERKNILKNTPEILNNKYTL